MLESLFHYSVGFLALIGLVVIIIAAFFLHYESVDRKNIEKELYK